jgi:predicted ArsR family transcriptional regulator
MHLVARSAGGANVDQISIESTSTRNRILLALWRGRETVDDLARELGLTDNAVRAHLVALERDGLVRPRGQRRGARKPSTVYACTLEAERLLPKPYSQTLNALLDELAEERGELPAARMRRVGERLARGLQGRFEGLDAEGKRRALAEVFTQLGGIADVEAKEGGLRVRGYSCPLVGVARGHQEACVAMEAFIAALLGDARVHEECERNGETHCRFDIDW